ncbi:MAG: T9SS type A sorting domain-containing protein, partial [Bacteroidetes bacterium]|nr:T9SS type A sorting domain-containing protein [Bacteroidota bacterium]
AQSISFEYVDTDGSIVFENNGEDNQSVIIKGTITNETNEDIQLQWLREVKYIYGNDENSWESAVCDLNRCYLPFVSQADFTIPQNGTSKLDGYVYPNGIDGDSAIIVIHIVEKNSGDTLLSIDYSFYDDIILSSEESVRNTETLIYPNPAASYFRVRSDEMISSIEIFDILGKPVAEKKTRALDASINISHLNRGMYIIRIRGEAGKIIKTQRLKKDML